MNELTQKILVIDAHPVYSGKLMGYLQGLTFKDIKLCVTGAEALNQFKIHKCNYDLIIMSSQLPDVESLTVCKEIVQCCQPKPKMIVQVGLFAEEETINQFKESGVEVVLLRKEKDLHPLELAIEQLLNLTQWKTS